MQIDEIKTGENMAVPVDDLVERPPGEDLPRPRHENGCSVTECDIQILQNNLRYTISRSEELERQIKVRDREIEDSETRRKAESEQAAAQIADLTAKHAEEIHILTVKLQVMEHRWQQAEANYNKALLQFNLQQPRAAATAATKE